MGVLFGWYRNIVASYMQLIVLSSCSNYIIRLPHPDVIIRNWMISPGVFIVPQKGICATETQPPAAYTASDLSSIPHPYRRRTEEYPMPPQNDVADDALILQPACIYPRREQESGTLKGDTRGHRAA